MATAAAAYKETLLLPVSVLVLVLVVLVLVLVLGEELEELELEEHRVNHRFSCTSRINYSVIHRLGACFRMWIRN